MIALLVVIYDLHVMSIFSIPNEANAPSVIDPDAMLPRTIANKLLKPVSRR